MSDPVPNNPGNDFVGDDEALNRPDEKENEASARRDFLKRAGKTGIGAGLASFLLVGGPVKKALAAADNCVYPYDESEGEDVCVPYPNDNPDLCASNRDTGDECKPSYEDTDWCANDGTTGDQCPGGAGDSDTCVFVSNPASETGDMCTESASTAPDECNQGVSDVCTENTRAWGDTDQ